MPNGIPLGHTLTRAGRELSDEEFEARLPFSPEKVEWNGGIFKDGRERMPVLAMLLELLGTDAAVAFGSVDVWEAAVAARRAGLLDDAVRADEPPPDRRAEETVARVFAVLTRHAESAGGRAFGPGATFTAFGDDPSVQPSVAYAAGAAADRPDVAVVVVDPNETYGSVWAKLDLYARSEVAFVWILHPDAERVEVRYGERQVRWLTAEDVLTAEPTLPGFACPVAALFES